MVHSLYRSLIWKTLELGLIPDWLMRIKIRQGLAQLSAELQGDGDVQRLEAEKRAYIDEILQMPIAINQSDANQQHYEVPAIFFETVLGPHLKYSSGYWPTDQTDLAGSEESMLEMYCSRAELQDGMRILDLGCGWGSLTLYLAQKYPSSNIVSLSNSASQKEHIEKRAQQKGLNNITVYTGDMATFDHQTFYDSFDRILSIEMFEHMKNYEKLLEKLSLWLRPNAKLFVHIFCHREFVYHFKQGWMARTFFTGGCMPSQDLLLHFQKHLTLQNRWAVNGRHYAKTLEAWLRIFDANYNDKIGPVFNAVYGPENGSRWYAHWRMFFLVCAETFAYGNGNHWFVSHYLFVKPAQK